MPFVHFSSKTAILGNSRKRGKMLKRKTYEELLKWKNESRGKSALLLEGARRVGKTTLVRKFAENEYKENLFIDFAQVSDDLKNLFLNYRADIDSFFMYLQALTGKTLPKRESVIVFDEVQRFPPAREFIKQLVDDARYDYVETGSLISIQKNVENILIPSEEKSMSLRPMNFKEFLDAMGERNLSELIEVAFEKKEPLPDPLHKKSERLMREYMMVGGMPQAISAYIDTKDFGEVDKIKRDILALYDRDIEKFGGRDALRIRRVFSTLPSQLVRHDKKFRLSALDKNARGRDYADAFFWLDDAQISMTCTNVTDPSIGSAASADERTFKSYMSDTGLLISKLFADNRETPHEIYRDILLGKLSLNEGMFTENFVAQQLASNGHALYFHSKRDRQNSENTMEIDFLITAPYDDAAGRMRISPIEVKSNKRYGTSSLTKFKAKYGSKVGKSYILHPRQLSAEVDVVRLPLYMAHLL